MPPSRSAIPTAGGGIGGFSEKSVMDAKHIVILFTFAF